MAIEILSKRVYIPGKDNTGVFPGFMTYTHAHKSQLLHRFGWVDASDTYDNFHERVSEDNGKTWTEPVLKLKSSEVDGGRSRYVENSAFYDADSHQLHTFVYRMVYPKDKIDTDAFRELVIETYDPRTSERPEPKAYSFDCTQGIAISFCFPIKTSTGRILLPTFQAQLNDMGENIHHKDSGMIVYQARMVIGEYDADGVIQWRLGQPMVSDQALTTRGFSECSPVELLDGTIASLSRGSNYKRPDLPGYKWLSYSKDGGETWSEAEPLKTDNGKIIQSSATGCALFRSIQNGKVYFMGNLCADGKPADGNWPRSPLYIAEVQEESFAIREDSITVIDKRDDDDTDKTQISNFRFYQDRETGNVVVYATRFGENDAKLWKKADHYEYRVAVE